MPNRRVGRPRVARRMTDWIAGAASPPSIVSVPDGATRVITGVVVTEGAQACGTIIRIRGCIHVEIAMETIAPVLQQVGLGIGLFDDRAFAVANAAGFPKPLLDADDEKWMWWQCVHIGMGPNISDTDVRDASVGTGRNIAADFVVDSKAMRKWDENQTLALVVENELCQGIATEVEVCYMSRVLVKLP